MPSFGGGSGTGSIQPPTPPSSLLCSGGALGLDLLLLEPRIPSPHPPPTHDPIIGLGAVTQNKTFSASPLQRLSPSHGASRIRKRAGSPSHQEPLFPLQLTPQAPAVSGRSEPWRRTPHPLAHSAKADPPSQSLLSERRPDTAEPRYAAFLQNASVPALPYPGFHPGLVCCAPLGHSESGQPDTAEATKNRSGAVSGRSEPWRRTSQPPRAQRES